MEGLWEALAELFKNPSGQEITIRVCSIIGIGLGLRTGIRWWMHTFTKRSRDYIKKYSQHVVVPTQFIASMGSAWIYRWEIIPIGRIKHGDHWVDGYELVYLVWERMVAEGVLYGFGSIALYIGSMYLMKRYKIIK